MLKEMFEFLFYGTFGLFHLVMQSMFELMIMFELLMTMVLFYYFSELLDDDDLFKIAGHLSNDYFIFLEKTNFYSIVKQYYWHLPYAFFDSNTSPFGLLGYDSGMTVDIVYVTQNLMFSLFMLYMMILLYYFLKVTNSVFQIFEFFIIWISIMVMYYYVFLMLKFNLYLNTLMPMHMYNSLFILFMLFLIIWFSMVFFFMVLFFTTKGYNLSLFRTYMNFVFVINLAFIVLCIMNFYVLFNYYMLMCTIFMIYILIKSFYSFLESMSE